MQSHTERHLWLSYSDTVASRWRDALLLIARVAFGWIFVLSGWGKFADIPGFAATLPRRGLPEFLGYIVPFVEFIGGLLLVVGFATRFSALIMLLFIIVAAFSSHRYWAVEPAQVSNQFNHFWKNVSMMGGAVLLFVTGAGRYSVDRLLRRE